ncbi:MAG: ATP phosphoribosyltransferase regulatory subunit [Firmicutes bacterium]|nr:ATP phosphoribosyltransferase regulatory subunit [Bacillota bacterium]
MKKTFLQNVKGTFDAGWETQSIRNHVTGVLRKNFEAFGYLPLETAKVNNLSLLTYKYDPDAEIVREIYKIRDQGDRDLGLRFDLTVPLCKYIANNQSIKLPMKRYEIGKVWRNGPVKMGRTREFYQCDVDAVGIDGQHIEAELISLAIKCCLELGIKPLVKYGNRKLLPYSDKIISIIDKMAKVTHKALIDDLSKHMKPKEAEELIHNVKNAPKIPEVLDLEFALGELGVLEYCEYAPYLARGLNVYTGTVYELYDSSGKIQSSIGGGGRYDKIIGNFIDNGKQYPAVGLSLGLEPLMAVITQTHQTKSPIDLMLIPLGTESFAQKIANDLRAKGQNVLVYLGAKNLAKAFEYAAAYGIKNCAVIGPDEAKGKELVIKVVN